MANLPDEIWNEIFDYLEPHDLVSCQRVSHQLLKLARDSSLWRYKCFEKAPSAVHAQASRPNALSILTGALGGLSLGDTPNPSSRAAGSDTATIRTQASARAKAVIDWDCSHKSERIDWYSEFIARDATLSTQWADMPTHEVRGMAVYGNMEKVVGPLDNGSICVWDIQRTANGRHKLNMLGRSKEGILFQDLSSIQSSSNTKPIQSLGHAVENISIDSKRMRAYISAEDYLNEVDLERMEVISQTRYAWPITALSQERLEHSYSLTIGTSWSLHIHDPRVPLGSPALSPDGTTQVENIDKDRNIAFLPNYTKMRSMRGDGAVPNGNISPIEPDYIDMIPRGCLKAYARVEPGPQSILHRADNEIIIAGRMPSILFYDRRFFPRLESVIHSGARLSAMTTLSTPPTRASPNVEGNSTLIACGEYGGCGSLEIYELPHENRTSFSSTGQSPSPPSPPANTNVNTTTDSPSQSQPYKYRNRQEASSSKLLSLTTQGTRLIFSDSEGMLKWVECDGRGLARRWNINNYTLTPTGASLSGEQVVRKMISIPEPDSERGKKGDGDILVWTGEKIGVVTTKSTSGEEECRPDDALVEAFAEKMTLDDGDGAGGDSVRNEEEYAKIMRRALERQADERRWMSRFGVRRW